MDLIFESAAATVSRRRGRRVQDPLEQRAARALALVQVGELSSARQSVGGSRVRTPQWTHVVGAPEPSTSTSFGERTNPWRFDGARPTSVRLGRVPLRKDASVVEERVSWWTTITNEHGFSAGHSPLVFGGRAVGTRKGSPVHCLFDPSRQSHSIEQG